MKINHQLNDFQIQQSVKVLNALSAPIRLRIIHCLCCKEKNVGELLLEINTTQPNMSQHLRVLHLAGVIKKRRSRTMIYYSISDQKLVKICRLMFDQYAKNTAF
jgi:ArsR family transcriptional regulator